MFCIKCGVELTDGQAVCPVCNTKVWHPDFPVNEEGVTYPRKEFQSEEFNRKGLMFVLTIIFALPIVVSLLLEITMQNNVSWSGYVAGGVLLGYITFILPFLTPMQGFSFSRLAPNAARAEHLPPFTRNSRSPTTKDALISYSPAK